MLRRGEPRTSEDPVCFGSFQTAEEAGPVPSREHLCPSVLVWPEHRQERGGGKGELKALGIPLGLKKARLRSENLGCPGWLTSSSWNSFGLVEARSPFAFVPHSDNCNWKA